MDSIPVKILGGILLACWFTITVAHPKNSNVIPKEYIQRQMLPEIPGYIPVYIQHGEEPPTWKSSPFKQKVKSRPNQTKLKATQPHTVEQKQEVERKSVAFQKKYPLKPEKQHKISDSQIPNSRIAKYTRVSKTQTPNSNGMVSSHHFKLRSRSLRSKSELS